MYKNVGVYHICRRMIGYGPDFFINAAKTEMVYMHRCEWKNIVAYMDEAEIGSECNRSELSRLFSDAASGKLDHICIHSLCDLWHDAQKTMDVLQMLRKANPNIEVSLSFPPQEPIMKTKRTTTQLVLDALNLQRFDGELRFLNANFHKVDVALRNRILQCHIDPYMMERFLLSFYLEPKRLELEDLGKVIGLSQEDIESIRYCFNPSDEGYTKLIDWIGRDLMAYFLI